MTPLISFAPALVEANNRQENPENLPFCLKLGTQKRGTLPLPMSRQHEVNINNKIAQLLNRMSSNSQVQPENTVAFTKRKCIGGRAWPNVNFTEEDWDYAFSIWGNSTLGWILFWWHGSRQQSGRVRITVTTAKTLPVLDFRELNQTQIHHAKSIFADFKGRSFRPAFRADKEKSTLADLDRAVLCEWLGFGESIYDAVRQLARKWCAEPSVHGGKQQSGKIKESG